MDSTDTEALNLILDRVSSIDIPYWKTLDFWLNVPLALLGLLLTALSFREAKAAKEAANEAAQTVKIQTVTIELHEILQSRHCQ